MKNIEPGIPPPVWSSTRGCVERGLGEAHGHEADRDERAGDDREDRRVARLALRVLDREAQRLVARVEQEDDEEGDQGRLVPHPPVTPGGLGPDHPGGERGQAEDDREVDRDVGLQVELAVARAQVADAVHAAGDETAERDQRERDVQVEDLLDEALVGVVGRVEEDEREGASQTRE